MSCSVLCAGVCVCGVWCVVCMCVCFTPRPDRMVCSVHARSSDCSETASKRATVLTTKEHGNCVHTHTHTHTKHTHTQHKNTHSVHTMRTTMQCTLQPRAHFILTRKKNEQKQH